MMKTAEPTAPGTPSPARPRFGATAFDVLSPLRGEDAGPWRIAG